MSTINWPINPQLNATHTVGNKTWIWNGVGWRLSAIAKHADAHNPGGDDVLTHYVLTENTSLTPAANKIPITESNGLLSGDWIGVMTDKITTVKDLYNELTAAEKYLIMNMSGLVGYWSTDPIYLWEDSAGTIPASINGVIGRWDSMGTPAVQATTAVKPYLRKTATSNIYWIDPNIITSSLIVTTGDIGEICTIVKTGAEGIIFEENVIINSSYNLVSYNIDELIRYTGDIAIFNRPLTIFEKDLLTRYMNRGVPIVTDGNIY